MKKTAKFLSYLLIVSMVLAFPVQMVSAEATNFTFNGTSQHTFTRNGVYDNGVGTNNPYSSIANGNKAGTGPCLQVNLIRKTLTGAAWGGAAVSATQNFTYTQKISFWIRNVSANPDFVPPTLTIDIQNSSGTKILSLPAITLQTVTNGGGAWVYYEKYLNGAELFAIQNETTGGFGRIRWNLGSVANTTDYFTFQLSDFNFEIKPPTQYSYVRGVNIAGAEFNSGTKPGVAETNFTWNNEATYTYFANKGLNTMRVPILWERIQPTLNAALNTTYLNGLKKNIAWAKAHNSTVIIDVHNYGRYNGGVIGVDANVPISAFTDLWVRLSDEFKDESGVYAYDLMNEPHGMGSGVNDWKVISQSALTAIRNNNDNKMIMVEGTYYANASGWETKNGSATGWISDPADNFMYSAHCYFDSDNSGTYTKTYDQELATNSNLANVGAIRVMDFLAWCNKNNVKGYIGEFGIPNNDSRWNTVLDNFMKKLDLYSASATYWAAGTWWGSYALSVHPTSNFTVDAPQMSVLLDHLAN